MDIDGPGVRGRRGEIALVTMGFLALAFGFLEVTILGIQRHLLHRFVWTPGPFAWMTPLGYLILFVPLGGLLACIDVVRPSWLPRDAATFAFTFLGAFAILSMLRTIHPLALLLVALGIAMTIVRFTAKNPSAWRRLRYRGLGVLSVLWVVTFGLAQGLQTAHQSPLRPSLQSREKPNVLLIIWDTVRAQSLSLYGYEQPTTPFLEELATEGTVFDLAYATAPWTLPSHASLFTGKNADDLPTNWLSPLDSEARTIAEAFRDAGYRTAGFTANSGYTNREKGLAQGFDLYVDHRVSVGQVILSSALGQVVFHWGVAGMQAHDFPDFVARLGHLSAFQGRGVHRRYASDINREFLQWLDQERRRPFFAFLNFMDAHEPYYAPSAVARGFQSDHPIRDAYDAAIAHLDASLRRLLASLDDAHELEQTIVVLAADHGELLGEHGLWRHGNSLYGQLLHVPLLFWSPDRVPSGKRVEEPVSLRHVGPTLLELAGVRDSSFGRRTLVGLWSGPSAGGLGPVIAEVRQGINTLPTEPVTLGDMASITTTRFHYIVNGDGRIELFDHVRDPAELENLAPLPGRDSLIRTLGDALRKARAR